MEYQTLRGGSVQLQSIMMPKIEFPDSPRGDALYAMELSLALEKLNYEKLLEVPRLARPPGTPSSWTLSRASSWGPAEQHQGDFGLGHPAAAGRGWAGGAPVRPEPPVSASGLHPRLISPSGRGPGARSWEDFQSTGRSTARRDPPPPPSPSRGSLCQQQWLVL